MASLKLTPEVQETLCEIIAETGCSYEVACAGASERLPDGQTLTVRTMHTWIQKGNEQTRGRYRNFVDMLDMALARFELKRVRNIVSSTEQGHETVKSTARKTASGEHVTSVERTQHPPNIKGDIFLLQHRFPDRWGSRTRVESKVQADVNLKTAPPPRKVEIRLVKTGFEERDHGDPDAEAEE